MVTRYFRMLIMNAASCCTNANCIPSSRFPESIDYARIHNFCKHDSTHYTTIALFAYKWGTRYTFLRHYVYIVDAASGRWRLILVAEYFAWIWSITPHTLSAISIAWLRVIVYFTLLPRCIRRVNFMPDMTPLYCLFLQIIFEHQCLVVEHYRFSRSIYSKRQPS